jgi:vacuolar-type H+-ATPase subunit E/Vma4
MPPKRPQRRTWVKPYNEQIQSNTLEVIERSSITLNVQATDKLKEVAITGLDGKTITKQLNGAEQFTFHFTADGKGKGSIKFNLVQEQGLTNNNLPDLEVIVKTDEPPKFKLISPDGDYLATDVASVPITFEVTDDFGLDSAKMRLEIPGQQPKELAIPLEEGVRSREFTHTIELEQCEVAVGDSILFYAQATDIDTGSTQAKRLSSSEVYFIEIRPYRQNWHPKPRGGKPGQASGAPPVELLHILEYTRAILKKTWVIAGKPDLTQLERSRLEFIDNDVQYCGEQLAIIRDDSEYGFDDRQKAVLNSVLGYYEQASKYLAKYDAASAIVPEKNAYRALRKFILELELEWNPPESGQGQQPKKPDSVKLQETPEFSEYEKERIKSELKQVQQKLEKLTKEQKVLKRTFENFLEQQAEEKKTAQKTTDEKSSTASAKEQGQDKGSGNQQSKASTGEKGESSSGSPSTGDKQDSAKSQSDSKSKSAGEGKSSSGSPGTGDKQDSAETQGDSKSKSAGEGKSASSGPGTGDKQSDAESQGGSKGQGSGKDQSASDGQGPGTGDKQSNAESKGGSKGQGSGKDQSASDGQGSGGKSAEGQREMQSQSSSQHSTANAQARLRMLQAKQRALQEQVSQLKRELQQLPEVSENGQNNPRGEAQKHLDEAVAKMDDFQDTLTEARYQADMDERESKEAVELMESAMREMDLATEALDGELMLSNAEKMAKKAQEMAEQLAEDADALDESVTPMQREDMLARLEAAKRLLEMMPKPQWATVGNSKAARSAAALVFTTNPKRAPAEAARQMARQFWSIAVDAKKRQQQLIDDEPSDVKFYGQENEFFENAARFNRERAKE